MTDAGEKADIFMSEPEAEELRPRRKPGGRRPEVHAPEVNVEQSPQVLPEYSHRARPRVTVAGVDIDNVNAEETLSLIDRWLDSSTPRAMAVVNAAKVAAATADEALRGALKRAHLVTADGMSVVWASRLLGTPLPERVTGIDTFEDLMWRAASRGLSVYLLGARDESVAGVVARLESSHPKLRVAGFRNGYFSADEGEAVAKAIKESRADLLFVAMGSPRQDIWIDSNLAATGVRFALGVGGAFDHVSGISRRAPRWMQRSGLEWMYRFLREPRRLWRRYLIGNSVFMWLVLKQLLFGDRPKPESVS